MKGPRYIAPEGYNPRHDPEAPARILHLLMEGWREHPGEPVHLEAELGTHDVWAIHFYVEALRRVGHRITGRRGVPGYCYEGCDPPPRWLHIDKVLAAVARSADADASGSEGA
jgi:hypothetical protein